MRDKHTRETDEGYSSPDGKRLPEVVQAATKARGAEEASTDIEKEFRSLLMRQHNWPALVLKFDKIIANRKCAIDELIELFQRLRWILDNSETTYEGAYRVLTCARRAFSDLAAHNYATAAKLPSGFYDLIMDETPTTHSDLPHEETGLLPCPFCGKSEVRWTDTTGRFQHWSDGCPLDCVTFTIQDWNRRVTQIPEHNESSEVSRASTEKQQTPARDQSDRQGFEADTKRLDWLDKNPISNAYKLAGKIEHGNISGRPPTAREAIDDAIARSNDKGVEKES